MTDERFSRDNFSSFGINSADSRAKAMRPKSEPKQVERALFQSELEPIIDLHHPLVRLGTSIDWGSFEAALGATYDPAQGAPGTPI